MKRKNTFFFNTYILKFVCYKGQQYRIMCFPGFPLFLETKKEKEETGPKSGNFTKGTTSGTLRFPLTEHKMKSTRKFRTKHSSRMTPRRHLAARNNFSQAQNMVFFCYSSCLASPAILVPQAAGIVTTRTIIVGAAANSTLQKECSGHVVGLSLFLTRSSALPSTLAHAVLDKRERWAKLTQDTCLEGGNVVS